MLFACYSFLRSRWHSETLSGEETTKAAKRPFSTVVRLRASHTASIPKVKATVFYCSNCYSKGKTFSREPDGLPHVCRQSKEATIYAVKNRKVVK
ncbi:hypothetical protein DdX_06219 [Ditylenchus destructor]|uniref:Uncharacterized protein n=1 Tax=Ditylenchus destructor TaxID=166010 RepID=A0AAD4R6E9_9BILA|nr:hypothetical protein DdX_06219 [Ditylenchus destructor]